MFAIGEGSRATRTGPPQRAQGPGKVWGLQATVATRRVLQARNDDKLGVVKDCMYSWLSEDHCNS